MGEVRYCTTEDGVRIAYSLEGGGPPLVICPWLIESFSLDDLLSRWPDFLRVLGEGRTLVRFDSRGTGLSERAPADISHDSFVCDLEAVVAAAGLERLALMGSTASGPLAISYTRRNPERVSSLILYGTYACMGDFFTKEFVTSYAQMAQANWDMAAQVMADLGSRKEFPEESLRWKEVFMRSVTGEMMARLMVDRYEHADLTPILPEIMVRTLILHRRDDSAIPFANAQKLASLIPNARLVPLAGETHDLAMGDWELIAREMDAFLAEDEVLSAASHEPAPVAGFRTILFTDIVSHTSMMHRLGDAAGRDVLRDHERITREVLKAHAGAEVKTMGDGFMASFASVTRGMECAIDLQRAFAQRNESASEPLQIRVGLNAGEPIEEEGPDGRADLFGEVVILASRIAAQADGGEILASLGVRELCAGKGFLFADRGEVVLRGFEDPVRVYEVHWRA